MRRSKFIAVLQIAFLIYGQLVANVHAIGHLHLDENSAQHHLEKDHVHIIPGHTGDKALQSRARFQLSSLIPNSKSRIAFIHSHSSDTASMLQHSGAHAKGKSTAEYDCAIYHALLSLNVILELPQSEPTAHARCTVNSTLPRTFIASSAPDQKSIRAPPIIS